MNVIGKMEGKKGQEISERLRNRIVCLAKLDLEKEKILDICYMKPADLIVSSLCIEAVAKDFDDWVRIIRNIKKHLKSGGHLFLFGVLEESFYMVKQQRLPCLAITEQQIKSSLEKNGFNIIKFNV